MLSQLQKCIWRFGAVAIATAMVAPAAWGDPGLTDHTAQDPKPPWKIPPDRSYGGVHYGEDAVSHIQGQQTPISVALRDLSAQSFESAWSDGLILSPGPLRGSTVGLGGGTVAPVPAPGALALFGLGALMVRTSRRRR